MASEKSKYECPRCGWVYDPSEGYPEGGIAPGTPFKDIPNSWKCPFCGAPKAEFVSFEDED